MHLKDLFAQTLSLVYRFIFPQEDMEHATHLQTTERWQEALNESDNRLLFLFKHSTT